jgi:hypothetical protein
METTHDELQLGEDLLDWTEIGAIGRLEEQMGSLARAASQALLPLRLPRLSRNDDIPLATLLPPDIEREEFAIIGPSPNNDRSPQHNGLFPPRSSR